uniref:Uncharacterized protein n=1 Tax=Anguilla anguilla TaxID=7936 RepID=A0A0E9UZB2_ANGAN
MSGNKTYYSHSVFPYCNNVINNTVANYLKH